MTSRIAFQIAHASSFAGRTARVGLRALCLAVIALPACVSDLSVGVSRAEVTNDDDSPADQRDAGMRADGSGPVRDAAPGSARDASDARSDDLPDPDLSCPIFVCIGAFIGPADMDPSVVCAAGREAVCMRPSREEDCAWSCE